MPSLPDNDQSCNTHLASLVAIRIVTHILNEAQDIVNKANDSGQSWRYVWRQKKRNSELYENAELSGIGITDSKINDSEIKHNNVIVTSTPQKQIDVITRDLNESGIIGQGDEDFQTRNFDLRSPSILIDCLLVSNNSEREETFKGNDDGQNDLESQELLASTVTKLVESLIDLAINTACGDVLIPKLDTNAEGIEKSNSSSYSMLDDAYGNVVVKDEASVDVKYEEKSGFCTTQLTKDMVNSDVMEEIKKKDIDMYEKTYSTLNRDYDKFSEEEDFLEDQKSVSMHEVELPTLIPSSENVATRSKPDHHLNLTIKKEKEIVTNSTKVTLLKRCRLRGSKFLSRLRSWWWKQRLIGKRKASRTSLMPGMCPLSPKARNRTASFLDHCKVRSSSPTRMCAWKFNTLNEAIIHTYKKKEFEMEFKSTTSMDE